MWPANATPQGQAGVCLVFGNPLAHPTARRQLLAHRVTMKPWPLALPTRAAVLVKL